jgi:hypothetical protein
VANFSCLFLAAVFYIYGDVSVDSYHCLLSVVPVKIYANTDLNKLQILKENKGKSGIYLIFCLFFLIIIKLYQ